MTLYYYSRVRILTFTLPIFALLLGLGIYLYKTSNDALNSSLGVFFVASAILFLMLYRRIIVAVLKRKPALKITPSTIEYLGNRKFTWDDIEYYRLIRGVVKSSIEIKLYDNKEDAIRKNRTLRSYFDKLPLLSFNKSILIVDLTFIIGANEYIVQSFEKYDLIGQESQRIAS
ncbi:MAG: hypothetical protein H7Y13_00920 [Sphingobacteriaceae bacterium]|nr:hypothetical protein [Sphingobacteriaceae bacterium]